jgi:hypothetical protein
VLSTLCRPSFSCSSQQNSSFAQAIGNEENITQVHGKYHAQEKFDNLLKDAMSIPGTPLPPASPASRYWAELVKILGALGKSR